MRVLGDIVDVIDSIVSWVRLEQPPFLCRMVRDRCRHAVPHRHYFCHSPEHAGIVAYSNRCVSHLFASFASAFECKTRSVALGSTPTESESRSPKAHCPRLGSARPLRRNHEHPMLLPQLWQR